MNSFPFYASIVSACLLTIGSIYAILTNCVFMYLFSHIGHCMPANVKNMLRICYVYYVLRGVTLLIYSFYEWAVTMFPDGQYAGMISRWLCGVVSGPFFVVSRAADCMLLFISIERLYSTCSMAVPLEKYKKVKRIFKLVTLHMLKTYLIFKNNHK